MEKDTYRSQFRMPQALYLLLKSSADRNKRNLNAELIFRLEEALKNEARDQFLSSHAITREEFDETAKMVERAWPVTSDTDDLGGKTAIHEDLEQEIEKLSDSQKKTVLLMLRSLRG